MIKRYIGTVYLSLGELSPNLYKLVIGFSKWDITKKPFISKIGLTQHGIMYGYTFLFIHGYFIL